MTPADRARIAREWGIPEDQIPEPTVCPTGATAERLDGWRDIRRANWDRFMRARKFQALAEREGRILEASK